MTRSRTDRGAAAVEAALILPLVVFLVLGALDFGRAFFDKAAVQEAAQEGALYAAHHPNDPVGAIARAEETMSNPSFTGNVTVTCDAPDQIRVTVSYNFNAITPFAPATIDLSHSEVTHVLKSQPCTPSP